MQRKGGVTLRDDREYERRKGQWIRLKQSPPQAKSCVVLHLGKRCRYDERQKMLFVNSDGGYTEFPSKSKAQKAIYHTVKKSGVPNGHLDYEVELI